MTENLTPVYFDRPGVVRIGDYRPRTTYRVSGPEAERLVLCKGFEAGEYPPDPPDEPETPEQDPEQ